MPHDQYSNFAFDRAIYNGVGKDFERETAAPFAGRCTEARMLRQKLGDPFKFIQKAGCNRFASVFKVKIQGPCNIAFSPWVDRVAHYVSLARSRARAS